MGTRKSIKSVTTENSIIFTEEIKCPLCNEKQRLPEPSQSSTILGIQFHLISHIADIKLGDWENRLEKMEKECKNGDWMYKCDKCRKKLKGGTEDGAKKAMLWHLAAWHDELRTILEKYSSLDKGNKVYFFVSYLVRIRQSSYFYRFH